MPENVSGESRTVDLWMKSTLERVDRAESMVLEVAERAGFEEAERDRLGMAVRESMVNAVVHGNRYSAHKKGPRGNLWVSRREKRVVAGTRNWGDG
jgi:serine/threonine-protein kinase RsbW